MGVEPSPRRSLGLAKNERILLANLLQSSRSTLSRGSFLSFLAFKEGMLSTPISVLGGWPTVSGRFLAWGGSRWIIVYNIINYLLIYLEVLSSLVYPLHDSSLCLEGLGAWSPRGAANT